MRWIIGASLGFCLALWITPCLAQVTASCWDGNAKKVVACSDTQKTTVADAVAYLEKRWNEAQRQADGKEAERQAAQTNADANRAMLVECQNKK